MTFWAWWAEIINAIDAWIRSKKHGRKFNKVDFIISSS